VEMIAASITLPREFSVEEMATSCCFAAVCGSLWRRETSVALDLSK
jgi:hypothetical protein